MLTLLSLQMMLKVGLRLGRGLRLPHIQTHRSPVPESRITMSQVLEAAKLGDPQAIAALINRSLKPQGISAKVICENAQMKILLESLDIPNKDRLTEYVLQGLSKVGVSISRLEIYGKRTGQEGYAWNRAFQVDEQNQFIPVAAAAPQPQPVAATTEAPADNPFLTTSDSNPFTASASAPSPGMNANSSSDDILAMAQAGNLEAIEHIVKAALADKEDLIPLIELNGDVLKVTIETTQFLDGPAFCGEFGTKMNVLAGGVIKELEIYKRKSEKTMPFLMKKATLFTKAEAEAAEAPPEPYTYSSSRPNGQSSAMYPQAPAQDISRSGSQGRPTGVLVVAIIYFFFGAICTALGGFSLIAAFFLKAAMGGNDTAAVGMAGFVIFVMAGVLLALGLGRIWIGIGLLRMSASARSWALRLEGFSMMRSIFVLLRGDVLGGVIGLGISLPIWWYLAQAGMADRFYEN